MIFRKSGFAGSLCGVGCVHFDWGGSGLKQALVSAFEQKLQKPIFVSRYCHLTGALGVCLILKEKCITQTKFRGLDFYKESPQVSEEICELCHNHCKLKRVHLAGESLLWGFLCGRDENSTRRVPANQSGFDLLSRRRRIFNPKGINAGRNMVAVIGN